MTRIRTDLPLISDKEMEEWAQDIVESTHYRDVKTLRMKLDLKKNLIKVIEVN